MTQTAWPAHTDRGEGEGKWDRSLRMLRLSWSLISRTPAMQTVAATAFVAWVVAFAALFGPVFAWWAETGDRWVLAVGGAIVAYPFIFITVYFSVALLFAANACIDGERIGVRESFRAATRRIPQIAGWALLAAGVGAALDALAEWVPGVGALASWILGTVWSLATLFAIPVIVVDGAGGRAAAKRSAQVFRKQWGEATIGFVSITFFTVVLAVPGGMLLCLGALGGATPLGLTAVGLGVTLLAVASFLAATVERLFGLVLYRYVVDGELHAGFSESDLRDGLFFKGLTRRRGARRPA
jgi:hypothetical protein